MMVSISSLFALFIGMFIIYNSFAIAVTQRRSEIGILRALGATRRQIRWLFLGESAVTGLIGSLGGLVFGLLIARGIAASIGDADRATCTASPSTPTSSRPVPGCSALALVIGVATSIVAALIPARKAARVDPVQALQKGKYQVLSAGESRIRAVARGGARRRLDRLPRRRRRRGRSSTSATCSPSSSRCCSSPLLSLALARALRPLLKWLRPVEGALAADSLIQAPRRTSASVAALMLSLALVVAFAGMARASYASIIDWMDTALNPDLFVTAVAEHRDPHAPVSADDGGRAGGDSGRRACPDGPRRADRLPADAGDDRRGRDREHRANRAPSSRSPATPTTMYRLTAAGRGLMVSDNLAQLQRLTLGDILEIPAPTASSGCRSSASSSTTPISRARS